MLPSREFYVDFLGFHDRLGAPVRGQHPLYMLRHGPTAMSANTRSPAQKRTFVLQIM